jgi:hypothetical protein
MKSLKPVDRLEIHILVDNATDSLSSVPAHIGAGERFCPRGQIVRLAVEAMSPFRGRMLCD